MVHDFAELSRKWGEIELKSQKEIIIWAFDFDLNDFEWSKRMYNHRLPKINSLVCKVWLVLVLFVKTARDIFSHAVCTLLSRLGSDHDDARVCL